MWIFVQFAEVLKKSLIWCLLFEARRTIFMKYKRILMPLLACAPSRKLCVPGTTAMTIRFVCTACRTTMKLEEAISDQKKVRCSGCGTVILVSPHPSNPGEVVTSIPNRSKKPKKMSETMYRNILVGLAIVLVAFMGGAIYYTQLGEPVRAAVEGNVTLDGNDLTRGEIVFTPVDTAKGAHEVRVPIARGLYSASRWTGPYIGQNKVQIIGSGDETVAPRFNTESDLPPVSIQAGANKQNFETTSK